MKNFKIKYLLPLLAIVFIGCSPEEEDYSKTWIGKWKTEDETVFPQSKYTHEANITKSSSNDRTIFIGGELFGLNSEFSLTGKLTSSSKAEINYKGQFNISGSAYNNESGSITFYLTITQGDKSVKDTIKASKIN